MAGRTFAQINCSLTRSKRVSKLQDHKSRWAYLCVHLSDFTGYSGLFRYPRIVWSDDADLTPDELNEAISDLTKSGLIEYDHDEEMIRVSNWYYSINCPNNASRMIGIVSDYDAFDMDDTGMYLRSVAEFLVGANLHAKKWKPDSSDRFKMVEALGPFSRQVFQEFGDDFLRILSEEVLSHGKAVRAELGALLPPLEFALEAQTDGASEEGADRVSTYEYDTIRDEHVDDSKTKTNTNPAQNIEIDPSSDKASIGANVEVLRRSVTASLSARNSPLAKSARGL